MSKLAKVNKRHDFRKRKVIAKRFRYGRKETHELLIFRSCKHLYAAVLSLADMHTMFSISSLKKRQKGVSSSMLACAVGKEAAAKCCEMRISPVVNTAEYRFHGVIKSLVDAFNDSMKK